MALTPLLLSPAFSRCVRRCKYLEFRVSQVAGAAAVRLPRLTAPRKMASKPSLLSWVSWAGGLRAASAADPFCSAACSCPPERCLAVLSRSPISVESSNSSGAQDLSGHGQ
jgi:hypothetical protein